jgi:hypothetical protein
VFIVNTSLTHLEYSNALLYTMIVLSALPTDWLIRNVFSFFSENLCRGVVLMSEQNPASLHPCENK